MSIQKQFSHLDPIQNFDHKVGGLSFNTPQFGGASFTLNVPQSITVVPYDNNVIKDIGKVCTLDMAKIPKYPVEVKKVVIDDCHQKLVEQIGGTIGVMDMMIKKSGDNNVIIL